MTIIQKNKDIKTLVKTGRINTYKDVSKKSFIKSLRAFYTLLEVLNEAKQLMKYHYLKYQKSKYSSVLIVGASTSKHLIFSEHDNGQTIQILDLI